MPKADIVEANGALIPAIGLGTWTLKDEACIDAVRWALELGYRHLDTAAMYGNEREVGEGLRASGVPHDEVFVTTKVWTSDIAPGDLERSAEASLTRLGLDHVDLLLIHWPNDAVPLAQSTAALCNAKARGLARHIGVSNYPSKMLAEAVRLATEPLVTNQVEFHPYLAQDKVRSACRAAGMALTAYCPLGRLSVLDDPALREIAEAHGVSVSQVVMRWHMQQPGTIAIPKSGTRRHIEENLAVFGFTLTDAEMGRISGLARPDGRVVNLAFAPAWDNAA